MSLEQTKRAIYLSQSFYSFKLYVLRRKEKKERKRVADGFSRKRIILAQFVLDISTTHCWKLIVFSMAIWNKQRRLAEVDNELFRQIRRHYSHVLLRKVFRDWIQFTYHEFCYCHHLVQFY